MYPLIRRYLRRVDVFYLLLCAACSALSVVVLVSIGQTQLGSNNKASVQLIASLLGLMLAVVFSTADYHALARAWPLHAVVAWGLVLPTLFLHNVNTGLVTIGYDAGGTSNYSWYRVGGMTFQPAELAKISFILTLALHLSNVRGQVNKPKNLLLLLLHIGLPAAAIHVQGDDGTALVFLGIGLVMLFAGGLSHWLVAGGLAAGGARRPRGGVCRLGVVSLHHIQQEALLSDAEGGKGLIQVAGVQRRTIQVHHATSVIDTIGLQAGAQGGILVDDNRLTLDVVADSNLNHDKISFNSINFFVWIC